MTPEQIESLKKLADTDSNHPMAEAIYELIAENEAQAARIKEREAERDANFAAFHETCVISSRRGSEIDALKNLLQEVSRNFTSDDDLPDNLLPRIDAAMKGPTP